MRLLGSILLLAVAAHAQIGGGGGGGVISPSANGAAFWDGSKLTTTATGGAGTLCLVSTAGGTPVWGSCAGSAATAWSALTNPAGNLTLAIGNNTTTFTAGTNTTTPFLFQDTTANVGTGPLVQISTIGTSTAVPIKITAQGTSNGVQMSSGGVLMAIGGGAINANQFNGGTMPASATVLGTNSSSQPVSQSTTGSGSSIVLATGPTISNPTFTGTVTAAALSGTTLNLSGNLTTNITGGGVQCLHASNTGVVSGTGSDCGTGGAGSTAWSAMTNPTGALSLSMAAFTTTFTYNASTGAGTNLFNLTDTASNTGTGYLLSVNLASGSAAAPAQFAVNGNGVAISNSGVLAKLGTGSVNADEVNGATVALSTVVKTNGSGQFIAAVSGTDYAPATSGTLLLKANGSGGFANASTTDIIAAGWTGANCGTGTNVLLVNGSCLVPSGKAAVYTSVSFSATPTFTATSNTIDSFAITSLTANVTSSTLSGASAGEYLGFKLCQDATGGRTFAWPTGFSLAPTISPIASACTKQLFLWDGSNAVPIGSAAVDAGPNIPVEISAPATPGSGEYCWADSTAHLPQCKDGSANLNSYVRTAGAATAHKWVDFIAATGIPDLTQPAFSDLSGSLALAQTPLTTRGDLLVANSTPALARLALGSNGQCLTSNGSDPVWGSCSGAASVSWSNITAPGGNLSLSMTTDTTTFTWGAATGSATDLLTLTDTTNNTGTGFALVVNLASGSAAKPAKFAVNGNGVTISNTGVLAKLGTGSVNADALNGTAFSGTQNDVVTFGASNTPADSGVLITNVPTTASNYTSGNLVQAAGNNKTQSDSGIATVNVVTAASAAAGAKQICTASGASKTCSYIDFPEVLIIPAANCNNTTAGAGWSIGSGGTVTCRAGTNNLGGYVSITDTASTFATFQVAIPEDWDTGTNPYIRFQVASTDATNAHTIIPSIQVACYKGDGTTTDDVAANAAHSLSTVTLNGNANRFWSTSNVQLNSTDMTGCVAGALMQVTVGRATDTATNAEFYSATVTIPRLIVVQAN